MVAAKKRNSVVLRGVILMLAWYVAAAVVVAVECSVRSCQRVKKHFVEERCGRFGVKEQIQIPLG